MIPGVRPIHISAGDLAKSVRSILRRVEAGSEVLVEAAVAAHTELAE
jgi:hypothetical protein